jgi:hypothetical protein
LLEAKEAIISVNLITGPIKTKKAMTNQQKTNLCHGKKACLAEFHIITADSLTGSGENSTTEINPPTLL